MRINTPITLPTCSLLVIIIITKTLNNQAVMVILDTKTGGDSGNTLHARTHRSEHASFKIHKAKNQVSKKASDPIR